VKWSTLEEIPKVPFTIAIRNPGLFFQRLNLLILGYHIRLDDTQLFIGNKIVRR
jgi:hypothetical protein